MDFFTVVPDPGSHPSNPRPHPDAPSIDSFAEAIASRFGHAAILTTRLTPGPLPTHDAPLPMSTITLASIPSSLPSPSSLPPNNLPHAFVPLTPASLPQWLDDPSTLVVDIRPHAAHSSARIPRALSLSVPSTLLKRPLFSLQRLSAMLPSASARNRFAAWKSASRIVVYDADSSAIPDSSNIQGLLKKFKSDGFKGELAWLQGGFQAVWRERRDLVDTHPPTPDAENDEEDDDHDKPSNQPAVLRTRHLPMAAFSSSSTTTAHSSPHFIQHSKLPSSANAPRPPASSLALSNPSHPAINPFFDTIRQNVELSHGITERIPLRLPRRVRRRINDLPFTWLQHIAKRAAKVPPLQHRPIDSCSSASEESEDDDGADPADVEEGSEALAMQFYRIELAEQRRLMGIMEHHSKESGLAPSTTHLQPNIAFPFSITAGVEKGAKNRYRHIWPFEHARVRLHQKREADDDYVNASYVQPLGTKKRYIATQGPLPATFVDFWTLCWEQNVHVIVMLTREIEGPMVKCGNYWADSNFGPLRLRLISTTGTIPSSEESSFGGFFTHKSSLSSRPHTSRLSQDRPYHGRHRWPHHHHQSETIKRVFELTHTGYPEAKPRKIVHLQYLDWPDMNVPEDPRGILGLIREVDQSVKETASPNESPFQNSAGVSLKASGRLGVTEVDEKTGIAKHAMGKISPVLLHCSAGVGRTGGFIAVDAVLDAIRREIRQRKAAQSQRPPDAMDIDVAPTASSFKTSVGEIPAETAAITMSAQANNTDKKTRAGPEMTVHIPIVSPIPVRDALKTPMQVDGVELPWMDQQPSSSAYADTTRQWAENVSKSTGQSSKDDGSVNSNVESVTSTSSSSPASTTTSDSSNAEGSTFGFKHSGSYRHPSSSLGTSVSVSSLPFYKASSFPAQGTTSSAPNILPIRTPVEVTEAAVIVVDQRTRTFSAPTDSQARALLQLKLPPAIITPNSDDDVPSRSQSPSVDESQSVLSQPAAPATVHTTFSFAPPSSPIPGSSLQLASADAASSLRSGESSKTFDYKEPRSLHDDHEPSALTSFEEPIWEVVQDMREQRMSLCQSLRQYVFVHAAIVEGALMVVDEENGANDLTKASLGGTTDATSAHNFSFGYPKSSLYTTPSRSSTQLSYQTDASDSASSYSCAKRAASPTELFKEGKGGEPLHSKRPSIKRKQRSGDEPEEQSRSPPFQRAQAQLTAGGGGPRRSPSRPR
ncbi:hypothetical protein BDQ17DRAFT_1418467 [Cyathus striatus]|nr:hypothetical protein BDQ17DRAFT_1418467 [Cyathus striatus]